MCKEIDGYISPATRWEVCIPDEVLESVSELRVDEEDEMYLKHVEFSDGSSFVDDDNRLATFQEYDHYLKHRPVDYSKVTGDHPVRIADRIEKVPLQILYGKETRGLGILKPVVFESEVYYIIVTCW